MKKFDVEITETLQRKVSVEAASQEDAERMVTQAWNNQDYVLDSGDFTGVDFKTVGEHEMAETRTMNVLLVQPNAYPMKEAFAIRHNAPMNERQEKMLSDLLTTSSL